MKHAAFWRAGGTEARPRPGRPLARRSHRLAALSPLRPAGGAPSAVRVARAAFLGASIVVAGPADAHHLGSHAARGPGGEVRLEAVATVADDCTVLAEVAPGAPPGVAPPPGSVAVTARLARRPGGCSPGPRAVRMEVPLALGAEAGLIHLYVRAADGSLASTERVPIRTAGRD